MFTNKPRPVPSKDALRFLYQLAYVSSGTALGVGVLCVEERRRRIQLVQKIADNAKRIRQSPRYIGSAGLGVQGNDDNAIEFYGGDPNTLERNRARGRRLISPNVQSEEAAKDAELPSIIESGYATVAPEPKEVARRVASRPRPADGFSGNRTSNATRSASGEGQIPTQATPKRRGSNERYIQDAQSQERLRQNAKFATSERRLNAENSDEGLTSHQLDPAATHNVSESPSTDQATFITEMAWGYPKSLGPHTQSPERFSSDQIAYDVRLLLGKASEATTPELFEHQVYIVDELLTLALNRGALSEIRSLCIWKLSHRRFSETDLALLCEASDDLSSRLDHRDLFGLFATVFSKLHTFPLNVEAKINHGLVVLTNALDWDLEIPSNQLPRLLFRSALDQLSDPDLARSLTVKCKDLVAQDQLRLAAELFFKISYLRKPSAFDDLASELLAYSLKGKQLSLCARFLKWKRRLMEPEALKPHLSAFVDLCDNSRAHGFLVDLFIKRNDLRIARKELVRLLSKPRLALLAKICANDRSLPNDIFIDLYRNLPPDMLEAVNETRRATTLKALWTSTGNLDAVVAKFSRISKPLRINKQMKILKILETVMLEIYIDANKTDQAVEIIARLHGSKDKPDSETISLAALVLAKRSAWHLLVQLLDVGGRSKPSEWSIESTHRLNAALRLYSKRQSAEVTWKFVTAAMDQLGFVPNYSTTQILLECFVSNKQFGLIPKWLRFLELVGYQFHLDARVAARLMTRYYLDIRPSHILMMFFSRNLLHFAPSFRSSSKDLKDLVKEAIGYDMRHHRGCQAFARARLARLEGATKEMPSPGYVLDSHLYFEHPGTTSKNQNPTNPDLDLSGWIWSPANKTSLETLKHTSWPLKGDLPIDKYDGSSDFVCSDNGTHLKPSTLDPSLLNLPEQQFSNTTATLTADSETMGKNLQPLDISLNSDQGESEVHQEIHPDLPQARFDQLRPAYGGQERQDVESDLLYGSSRRRKVEGDMILALSLCQYGTVIALLEESKSVDGVPVSPLALEIAVEASIRHNRGDRAEAEKIMSSARDAGMNVTCAMGPLLIHQMYHLDPSQKKDVNSLRLAVIEYYRMNEENGYRVNHHVGNTAANILINNHKSEHGLNLLDAIYKSKWAAEQPPDIVAMLVYLKGYTATRSMKGIQWVVEEVLKRRMLINKQFTRQLAKARRHITGTKGDANWTTSPNVSGEHGAALTELIQSIRKRVEEQKHEAKFLGNKLVKCIAKCVNEREKIDGRTERMLRREIWIQHANPGSADSSWRPMVFENVEEKDRQSTSTCIDSAEGEVGMA